MTMPDVSAPHPFGAAQRSVPLTGVNHTSPRRLAARPSRSVRDLTPFIFLAMILIPSLIVLGLAIADPGTAPSGTGAEPAVTVPSGS